MMMMMVTAGAKSSKWWPYTLDPWRFEPKINRLQHSVENYYCAKFQVSPIRGFRFIVLTYPPIYPHTHPHIHISTYPHTRIHRDKVIAISAPPYYVVVGMIIIIIIIIIIITNNRISVTSRGRNFKGTANCIYPGLKLSGFGVHIAQKFVAAAAVPWELCLIYVWGLLSYYARLPLQVRMTECYRLSVRLSHSSLSVRKGRL